MRDRSGISILESIAAIGLLAALLAVGLEVMTAMSAQRVAHRRQAYAIQTAANVMERFAARPWDSITPEAARSIDLPRHAARALPDGELAVRVDESPDGPPARRITVTLAWRNRAGQAASPAQLAAWVYRPEARGE